MKNNHEKGDIMVVQKDPDCEICQSKSETEFKDERNFEDFEYREAIKKALTDRDGDIFRSIEQQDQAEKVRTQSYELIIINGEFDFIKDWVKSAIVSVLVIVNIIANYVLYDQFLVVDKELLLFDVLYADTPGMLFPALVLTIAISSMSLFLLFLRFEALALARIMKYLFIVEILSIFGIAAEMFWAAIAVWSSFVVYFMFQIDLSSIIPDKESQLQNLEESKGEK